MGKVITAKIVPGRLDLDSRTLKIILTFMGYYRFFCYVRLSVIMGVPWIIEILSFSFDNTWLFVVSIFNCMQGFVIFITFVWNPRVIKQLRRRYDGSFEYLNTICLRHSNVAVLRNFDMQLELRLKNLLIYIFRFTGLPERNQYQQSQSRLDLAERNGKISGSVATLIDSPSN